MIDKCKVGDVVDGTITAIPISAVFVSFGDNLEGLIHISELAWQRIEDPSESVQVGDAIKAQIISMEGARFSCPLKIVG